MKSLMRRFMSFLCLGIAVFALGSACRQDSYQNLTAPVENCRIVQHSIGQSCIPLHPQRIVALDILSLSNAIALGIKPIAAAVWNNDIPPHLIKQLEGVTLYRYSTSQPDLERILQLKPDLIISPSDPSLRNLYPQLSQIAPTVLVPWAEISRDWKQHLIETAKVFNQQEAAAQLLENYYQRVKDLKQRLKVVKSQQEEPFYASFIFVSDGLVLAQQDSFAGELLHDLGLLSPQSSSDARFPISEETLPEIESDVFFVGSYQDSDHLLLERLQCRPLWSKVRAVQQNRVYSVNFLPWYGFDFLSAHTVLDDIEKHLVKMPPLGR